MIFGKKMSKQELGELRAINKVCKQESYKLHIISNNTALVYKGQDWVKTQADVVKVLQDSQNNLISRIANRLGFLQGEPVEVNLETGAISLKKSNDKEDAAS